MTPYYQDSAVTIYHDDCLIVLRELGAFDLVLTDPPYGMNYQSNHRKEKFDFIQGDESHFSLDWISNCSFAENASFYFFANEKTQAEAMLKLPSLGFNGPRLLIWNKGATSGGDLGDYGSQCEYVIYGRKKYAKLRGSRDNNIISIPRVHPTVLVHPTEKPLNLVSYLIMKSTDFDNLVLDPFMGSGTTLCAAKNLGRKAIGIEIEERYCEIAAKRMAQEVLALA